MLSRILTLCLLAFAVSPVTAPFTTCDLGDFMPSHPADDQHHPGRQMAEAHVKIAPHLVTMAFELAPCLARGDGDSRESVAPVATADHSRRDLQTVLRV